MRRLASICATLAACGAFLVGPATAGAAEPILYVGDSLGVGTSPYLDSTPAGRTLDVDAEIGRTSTEALSVLRAKLRPGHEVVIFDVGTNDWSPRTLARNLSRARKLSGRRLMIVLTMNKPGVGPFNRAVRAFARSTDDVALIPWHSMAARKHLLGGDGIHANASGYRRRAVLVAQRIQALQINSPTRAA
jgi:hypothetical protein